MTQATLGDLRTYMLPKAIDLPDGSVTLTPLYDSRTLDCEREAVYDTNMRYYGNQPRLERDIGVPPSTPIISNLRFKAFDALPSGYVRVLTTDRDGNAELLGEGRLDDTPKAKDATIALGNAFDLTATREQTSFSPTRPHTAWTKARAWCLPTPVVPRGRSPFARTRAAGAHGRWPLHRQTDEDDPRVARVPDRCSGQWVGQSRLCAALRLDRSRRAPPIAGGHRSAACPRRTGRS